MRDVTVAEWVWALRSGFYKQATGTFRIRAASGDRHCALGVGYDLAGFYKDDVPSNAEVEHFMASFQCLSAPIQYALDNVVSLNDHYMKSFSEIADWIEQNISDAPGKEPWAPPVNPEDSRIHAEEIEAAQTKAAYAATA